MNYWVQSRDAKDFLFPKLESYNYRMVWVGRNL